MAAAEGEAVGESSWKHLWGAKVQWPADMPDDMLKMAVETARKHMESLEDWRKDGDKAVASIKKELDDTWGPFWHVVAGKHFGSLATHESRRFCFFYLGDKAVMIYKAG